MTVYRLLLALVLTVSAGSSQLSEREDTSVRLTPENGSIVRPEFKKRDLKAEREQNLKDTARMAELVAQLRADLQRTDERVVSVAAAKKAAELETLIKNVRRRLR